MFSAVLADKKLGDQLVILFGRIICMKINAMCEKSNATEAERFKSISEAVKGVFDQLLMGQLKDGKSAQVMRHLSLIAENIKSSDFTRCFLFEDFNWLF